MFNKYLKQLMAITISIILLQTLVFADEIADSFDVKDEGVIDFYKYYDTVTFTIYTKEDLSLEENSEKKERMDQIITLFEPLLVQETSDLGPVRDMNSNNKFYILFHDMGVMGLVSYTHPERNGEDILEINDVYLEPNSGYMIEGCVGTMIHEIQHLIHKPIDVDETTFVNELMSVWAQYYYVPNQGTTRNQEYLYRLNHDNVDLDIHNYAEEMYLSRFIFDNYGGLSTMKNILNDVNNGYSSILSQIGIEENSSSERDFLVDLLDFTLGSDLYNNGGWPIILSESSMMDIYLKSRMPSVKYIHAGSNQIELILDSPEDENVKYLVKEVSFSNIEPSVVGFAEVAAYKFNEGTHEIVLNESDNYIVITPVYANVESTTTWSYSINTLQPNTPPVIALNGDEEINLLIGDSYIELSATANDFEDGDLTSNIVISGDLVDTNIVGSYLINYLVTDSKGLTDSVTRTVNVSTGNAPVISLNGNQVVEILIGEDYNELFATAMDVEDGDISDTIIISGDIVDTSSVSTYTINYSVTDSHGNSDVKNRAVNVVRGNFPQIVLNGAVNINLMHGENFVDPGATSFDVEDGNLSDSIVVVGGDIDTKIAGSYTISYLSTDSNENTSVVVRNVVVEENQAPTVSLNGGDVTIVKGENYNELGAVANDPEEGNLEIVISGDTVNTNVVGIYSIRYTSSDSEGLFDSKVRKVVVEEPSINIPPSTGSSNGGGRVTPVVVIPPTITESDTVKPTVENRIANVQMVYDDNKVEAIFKIEPLINEVDRVLVESEVADILIPLEVIDQFSKVTVNVSTEIQLTTEQNVTIGDAVVYDFHLYNDGMVISTFSKPLTITIPYKLKPNENPDFVTAYYIDESGKLENMKGIYSDGHVKFMTTHFSKYFIKENLVKFNDTNDKKVLALAAKGIISGKGNDMFDPDGNLTRAEVATLLVRSLGLSADYSETKVFDDVSEEHWAYHYIMVARELELVSGTSSSTYNPDAYIKRNDAIILISKALELFKSVENNAQVQAYDNTDFYALKYVSYLVEMGFIEDSFSNGVLNIKRLEMADLIHSLFFYNEE
ncbi:MAG: DUF5011 domain-containing protein [Clostridia bacterium]|nr:DUF5011 domain-containing protein [Clostridia bacterium]